MWPPCRRARKFPDQVPGAITDQNQTILLNNLSRPVVGKWMGSLFRQDEECKDDVDSLVHMVYSKTDCREPFLCNSVSPSPGAEGFDFYDTLFMRWKCHPERIQQETDICKNILDVVVGKIRWLPQNQQLIMVISSCLRLPTLDVKTMCCVLKPLQDKNAEVRHLPAFPSL